MVASNHVFACFLTDFNEMLKIIFITLMKLFLTPTFIYRKDQIVLWGKSNLYLGVLCKFVSLTKLTLKVI